MKKLILVVVVALVMTFAGVSYAVETDLQNEYNKVAWQLREILDKADTKYVKSGTGVEKQYIVKDSKGNEIIVHKILIPQQAIYGDMAIINARIADLDNAEKVAATVAKDKAELLKAKAEYELAKTALETQ